MEGDFIKTNNSLLPLSWLYGLAVRLRNTCFDTGILRSHTFDIPVIAVGNITVGGTGKTPHVEYLVRLLKERYHVAVLSRGYKRKTNGYLLADATSTVASIGDEPYQMKQKFPDVSVAVDRKRVNGIRRLTADNSRLDVILLDDAFQHRYVKPGINILLVDYHRLIIYDKMLPAGRLREPLSGKDRADIVIVTKCPKSLKPMDYRVIIKAMDLYPYQQLYFTTLDYGSLEPVFPDEAVSVPTLSMTGSSVADMKAPSVLLLTGIASPQQLVEDLSPAIKHLTHLSFPDHHDFRPKDIERINNTFAALPSPKYIITTEKDAVRIRNTEGFSAEVRRELYSLPVRIRFVQDEQQEKFNENIIGYVLKNSRNSILVKGKDDHKSQDSHRAGDRSRTISFRNN